MKIALETGLGGPVREGDAVLVGRVAFRHPLRLFDTDRIEKYLQPRRRALSDAHGPNVGGLNQRDVDALVCPAID